MVNRSPVSALLDLLERNDRIVWTILAATLTAAGLAYSIFRGPELVYPDENQYCEITRNIIGGQGFSLDGVTPTAYRPPGYPIFLLLPLSLNDSVHTARVANFLLLIAAMGFLHALIRRYASVQAAWLAVLLVFLYPVLFYTAGTLYPQILALFLIALISWLVLARDESWPLVAATGVLLGFLALVTPTCLFMLPLVLVAAPALHRWRWRSSVLAGLFAIAVMGAWSVRNQVVLGEPIFISTNISSILNSVGSEVSPGTAAGDLDAALEPLAQAARGETSGYLLRTVEFLLRNPGDYLRKLANFFHFHNIMVVKAEQSLLKDIVMFISYYSILGLAVGRFLLGTRVRLSRFDWWVAVVYLSAACFQALAFTRIRYRLPIDFLIIGTAGVTLHWILDWLGNFRSVRDDGRKKISNSRGPA